MKLNLPLMKLVIRLTVLMIFFVMIFFISTILYSVRFWPDIHNYINANITIKRIPTLSELNLTIIEIDYTTEFYTTEDFTDSSTADYLDIEGVTVTDTFEKNENKKKNKRDVKIESFNNDYSELPSKGVVVDYLFLQDDMEKTTVDEVVYVKKIVKDLIDESKLVPKNAGEIEIVDEVGRLKPEKLILPCHGNRTGISQIYPWIATIFLKNDTTNNQFEYYCDGALLSDKAIVTAARCVTTDNSAVNSENVLVFLGKRSLQSMTENEKVVRVNKILIHDNFTSADGVYNDLALLMMEEPVVYNDGIGPACLFDDDEGIAVERSVTTAWTVQGDLTPVYFISKNITCDGQDNKICDSYGLDVPLCPSYGGIYVSKQITGYYIRGIRTGDPADRGLCFNKDLQYTALDKYKDWIQEILDQ